MLAKFLENRCYIRKTSAMPASTAFFLVQFFFFFFWSNSNICKGLLKKKHSFDYTDLVTKVMSLLFNTLSGFVIAFLPKGKHL